MKVQETPDPSSTCPSCPRLPLVVDVARVWSYHVHVKYRIPLSQGTPRAVSVEGDEPGCSEGVGCAGGPVMLRLAATWR